MSDEEKSIFVSPAISGSPATYCLMFSREEDKKLTPFPTRVLLVVDGIKVSGLATRIALEIASGTDLLRA